jgi:E3 ubiquitin-protein ligase SHPRH
VPVCTNLHLLAFFWLDAPGYPSFPINVNTLQRFSIQPKDKDKAAQPPAKLQSDAIPKSHRKIEYNTVGPSLLAEIDTMEVRGSFGRKIDTLVRHLLYLQFADAGAKSIVFSAWEDSLHSAQFTPLTRIRSVE